MWALRSCNIVCLLFAFYREAVSGVIIFYFFPWMIQIGDSVDRTLLLVWSCHLTMKWNAFIKFALQIWSAVAGLPIFGGCARRARWCCKASHSEAWTDLDLTFVILQCWRGVKICFSICFCFNFCLQFGPDGLLSIVYFKMFSQMLLNADG